MIKLKMDDTKSVMDDWGQFVYLDNGYSLVSTYYKPINKFKHVKELRKFRTLPTIQEKNEALSKNDSDTNIIQHYSKHSSKIVTGFLVTLSLSLFLYKSFY
jgi:hypothetical protein